MRTMCKNVRFSKFRPKIQKGNRKLHQQIIHLQWHVSIIEHRACKSSWLQDGGQNFGCKRELQYASDIMGCSQTFLRMPSEILIEQQRASEAKVCERPKCMGVDLAIGMACYTLTQVWKLADWTHSIAARSYTLQEKGGLQLLSSTCKP